MSFTILQVLKIVLSSDILLLLRLKAEKECEVFIVLTPEFEGRANGKSLPLYSRLGKVNIY